MTLRGEAGREGPCREWSVAGGGGGNCYDEFQELVEAKGKQ